MDNIFDRPSERFLPAPGEIGSWGKDLAAEAGQGSLDSVMKSLAAVADGYGTNGTDRLQHDICYAALDWLQTLKTKLAGAEERLGAVRVIEYQSCMGNSDGEPIEGTERTMYLVYNRSVISDEAAERVLDKGDPDLDPRVVVLWPSQAIAMFPNLFTKELAEALREKGETNGKTDEA